MCMFGRVYTYARVHVHAYVREHLHPLLININMHTHEHLSAHSLRPPACPPPPPSLSEANTCIQATPTTLPLTFCRC